MSPVTIDLIFTLVVSCGLLGAGFMAWALVPGRPEDVQATARAWERLGIRAWSLVFPSHEPEHKAQVIYVHLRERHRAGAIDMEGRPVGVRALEEYRQSA